MKELFDPDARTFVKAVNQSESEIVILHLHHKHCHASKRIIVSVQLLTKSASRRITFNMNSQSV